MALWNGLGQAATIAQLVGADAAGLVSAILQAVRTARRNRKECGLLARRVMVVGDLLQLLQDSETTRRPEVRSALDVLRGALQQAYELVESCQEGSAVYGFIMAGRQAEQFRDVQGEIDSHLLVFSLVGLLGHIDITRRLDRIYNILVPPDSQQVSEEVLGSPTIHLEPDARIQENASEVIQLGNYQTITELFEVGQHHRAERPVAAPGNWRRAPNGVAEQEPRSGGIRSEVKPRITDVPSGVQGEHVAAGWPRWLTEVAAEAVRGWQPRKAESFEKLDKIGQGTYSSVYKARDLENGKIVALKKVRFANMDPESVRFMAREIHILRRLDHPNVVKLEGLVTSRMSSSLYLVFEYMEHDLVGLASTPGIKFTEPQVKCYMQQLLSGLDHCHNRGVLHRDIKGANLLLDNNGALKIADFGLATFFNPNQKQHLTSRVVTLWYRPPELLLGATNYGAAVDLWSAGCILAELLSRKPIMPGRTEVEQLHKIFKLCGSPSEEFWANLKLSRATIFKPQHPYRRCVNDVYKDFPPSALALLDHLLAVEPENRGTAASALESEFFTTKPYACDPSSLPKYPPSKEYDAKLRDEEARRQRTAAVKGQESETGRRKQLPAPNGNNDLQQRRVQVNPKSSSNKFTPKEDVVTGFPIDPPGRAADNGQPQRVPLMNAGRSSSTLGRSSGTDPNAQRFCTPQIVAAEMSNLSTATGQRGNAAKLSNLGDSTRRQYLREHRSSSRYSQLTAADPSDKPEWAHQFQEIPSSSHRKDDEVASKEPTVVNGTKKNRIHYSGPLMPPGVNMEEILREHERQIQQAVRRARLDKGKGKHHVERDQSESLLYTTQHGRL